MGLERVVLEFERDQGYLIPNDALTATTWRQYLAIQWQGSSTFLVFDEKHRKIETTVFTNDEANTPEQAVTIMYDWAKAHEYERKVSR